MAHRIRASYMQTLVEELISGPKREQIAAAAAPLTARINAHMGVSLVSFDDLDVVLRIVIDLCGEDRVIEATRRHTTRLRDSSLLRSLIDAVVRLSGLTPHAMFKVLPRARESLVSEAGTVSSVRVGDNQVRLELRGFPARSVAVNTPHFCGSWLGVLDGCGVAGTVKPRLISAEHGDVDFDIAWT